MTGTRIETLIVIAKEPVPGRVKTRLVPPLTHAQAAEVAAAALHDTLRAADAADVRHRVLALDGRPGPRLPSGWRCVPQCAGGLDDRLADAIASSGRGATVLVGMDTPQVRPEQLVAFDPGAYDAALGPAADGGYWAIAFTDPARAAEVIPGVPMSTAGTGAEQLRRLCAAGLRVQTLDTLSDVDDAATADAVAAQHPHGAFARTVRALRPAA